MPDLEGPLAVIAASYQRMAASTELIAQVLIRLEDSRRLDRWMHAYSVTLVGLGLVGTGWLVWYHVLH